MMCKADLKYETTLSMTAIFPAAKIAILEYDNATYFVEFFPGEVYLQSTAYQIKQIVDYDGTMSAYKADGIIRLKGIKNFEIFLCETSGGLLQGSERKRTYDSHKGMFGMVVMMKTLVDTFHFASMDAISAVNLYIVQAH
ncbi:hypothetical protein DFQ30_002897, partial [Apophysomyces sp. BC1015]